MKRKFTKYPSKITASTVPTSDIKFLAKEALNCNTRDELSCVIGSLQSIDKKLYLHYMEMLRDDSLSVGYIASDLSDTLYNMFSGVEACGKVMASHMWDDEDFDWSDYGDPDSYGGFASPEDFENWYRGVSPEDRYFTVHAYLEDGSEFWCDRLKPSPEEAIYDMYGKNIPLVEADASDYDYAIWEGRQCDGQKCNPSDAYYFKRVSDINACGNVNASTKSKYFANMVSCSSDPELDEDFLIEGYYDGQRRGLAESAETSDISALNELANEYANKGYYIVVHNLTDGVIIEFSADNWFNDIAPDGGAELFMGW